MEALRALLGLSGGRDFPKPYQPRHDRSDCSSVTTGNLLEIDSPPQFVADFCVFGFRPRLACDRGEEVFGAFTFFLKLERRDCSNQRPHRLRMLKWRVFLDQTAG